MERLYRHHGQVVASTDLLSAGWPYATAAPASPDQLKTAIHRLRQVVEPDPHRPRYVVTAPNGGYTLHVTGQPPAKLPR